MPDAPHPLEIGWTWASILSLAFTTGLFTAILNQGFGFFREEFRRRIEDRRAGKVLALSLSSVLTDYALTCHASLRFNRNIADAGGYGDYKLPRLPAFRDPDPGWEVLPPKIAAAISTFRSEVRYKEHGIGETDRFLGPPEAIDSATYGYAYLGFRAWQLSELLRKQYGFGRYSGDSGFARELKSYYRKANPRLHRRFWRHLRVTRVRRRVRQQWRRIRNSW